MVAHNALSNNHTIGEVEPRESTFRRKPLGLELNVNEPVDRKNGGHILHIDRLATQAPAESEILAFARKAAVYTQAATSRTTVVQLLIGLVVSYSHGRNFSRRSYSKQKQAGRLILR